MNEMIRRLKDKGFFHIFFSNIMVKAISFISSFLVVRLVTKMDYAVFSFTDNVYNYILLFSGMGLSSAYLKFGVAEDDKYTEEYFKLSFWYGIGIQLILSICLTLYYMIYPPYLKEASSLILLLVLYPSIMYFLQLLQAYTRSKMLNKLFSRASVINALTLAGTTILFVIAIGIKGVIYSRYISVILTIIFLVRKIDKKAFYCTNFGEIKLPKKMKYEYIKYGFFIMIAEFLSSVMPVNEIFLINNLLKNSEITANFKVAGLLPAQLLIVTNSIVIFLFPIIAKEKNIDKIENIIKKYSKLNFIVVLFLGIIGMLITPIFIKYAYGDRYLNAVSLSNMLWVVRILNTGVRMLPMNLIPAFGNAKINALISLGSVIIHFILEYIFILRFGVSGVFYASIIVYIGSALVYRIYLKHELNKRRVL